MSQTPAPAVSVRDADGQVTVRATRVESPINLDGRLDEAIYSTTGSIGDFVQQEPHEGEPGTETTVAWLFFDDDNIYVAARCDDSQPDRQIANEMRRDSQAANDNESFGVVFDTFHDRRNGFLFQVTLAGGLTDASITDERELNRDWNTVWDAKTARNEHGWTIEIVIPFKSLRFGVGSEQTWGVNFRRIIRWKNEIHHLTRLPASMGRRSIVKMSSAATLQGIQPPGSSRTFELKPYGIGGFTTDRPAALASTTTGDRDAGFDVKVGVTEGLTADFSYNTDFAQVEEDEQQVNLTRFSVLFPEKREFFLEGAGIFSFGGVQGQPRGGGGGPASNGFVIRNPEPNDVPVMFFSRRIGLNSGLVVPIDAGGRLTGKAGPFSIGLIDIRTAAVERVGLEPTNFAVVRLKRDILRRSAVGALFTDRSVSPRSTPTAPIDGHGRTYGVDGVFGFFENLSVNTYLAKTDGDAGRDRSLSYRGQVDYNADRYGLQFERLSLDERFIPDLGFLRRSAFTRSTAFARYSPRPKSIAFVRRFGYDVQYDYITDPSGRVESKQAVAGFRGELQSGDGFSIEAAAIYELLKVPFAIASHVTIPPGGYDYSEIHAQYNFGAQRRISGNVLVEYGSFYGGTKTSLNTGRGRIQITPQVSIEPGIGLDWVDLPQGSFLSKLVTTRGTYTITPRMNVGALVQYNSGASTFNTNIRFRWEYRPGSDFFVVYNDNRDTLPTGFPELRSRGFVVKLTRLFRF